MVSIDRSFAAELRPMEQKAVSELRSRIPAEVFPILDHVQTLFDGYADADTAKIIEALQQLSVIGATSADTRREIGELHVLIGQYRKGIEWLQPFVSGHDRTTSGYYHPYVNYLLGIASEALGNKQAATKYYQEMLRYWSEPEIEIAPIKDAKARLARLAA
jgi:tetratricopeptide (TPR) repeat protein